MNENFDKAFDWVMKWEGIFSDDPNDPGNWTGGQPGKGILKGTKFGISAMCVSPEMRILTSKLIWENAKNLKVGDKLITFDEFPEIHGKLRLRRYREGIIENISKLKIPCYKIKTKIGDIVCSSEHLWLRQHGSHRVFEWTKTKDLLSKKNKNKFKWDKTPNYLLYLFPVWEHDNSYEAGYIAGFIDGEGCVSNGVISFYQNEGLLINYIINLLKLKGYRIYKHKYRKPPNIGFGMIGNIEILGKLRPVRLLNKFVLQLYGTSISNKKNKRIKIDDIEYLNSQEVIAIKTNTNTLIVEGFASHNSYPHLDIKSLTKETAKEIYYKDYWLYNSCQNKPYPIDIIHFNTCINPGKAVADRILKEVITDEMYLLKLILYYSDLVNKYPIKKRYFVGWMNRVIDLMRLINI